MTSKLFTTRQGTILLGVIAALIAAVLLIVYLHQYRKSVNTASVGVVLVAKEKLEQGTPGSVIISSELFKKVTNYPKSSIVTGALVDSSALNGQVVVKDIAKGGQLTAADFGPATGSVTNELNSNQRAVVIALGSPQQVGNQISAGSHVDVWALSADPNGGETSVRLLFQDMYVLGTNGENVTLRVSPRQAGVMIFEAANHQVWFDLRPTIATNVDPHTLRPQG